MTAKLFDFNDAPLQDSPREPVHPIQAFQDALAQAGLGRPEIHPTGQIVRYDAPGEPRGKKSNWYVFFTDDIPGGAAGSWRSGGETSISWSAKTQSELSPAERMRFDQRMADARKLREQAEQARHAEAQIKAAKRWEAAKDPASNHAYLVRKKIKAHGIRQDEKGRLMIPVRDAEGTLRSLEYIDPFGEKRFLTGGELKGHFHIIPGEGHTAYLVEGYATGATVHEATGAEVVVAFSAGNLKAVAAAYKTDKRLIVAADNDASETGLKAAQATGLQFIMPDIVGKDFNDIAVEQGLQAVKRMLVPPENKFAKKILSTPEELNKAFLSTLSLSWTIKNVLPESSSLTMIYGPPSAGKSFAALDMALCVAHGIPWHEHATKKKPVLYLAAEGQAGVLKRIEAWRQYHDTPSIENFYLLPIPCLVDNTGQLSELIAMIRSLPSMPELIILDTLARSMLGDENSTLDMGRLVNACGDLHEATRAQIMLIHHTGKDETRGARGAIALTGATDSMFKVVRTAEEKQYLLICERQKDDEPFKPMVFNLNLVETGHYNADGDEVTSLVPVYDPDAETSSKGEDKKTRLSVTASIALRALKEAIKVHGEAPTEEMTAQMGMALPTDRVVKISHWREMAYRMGISDSEEADARRQAFHRIKNSLIQKRIIDIFDTYVWEIKT